MRSTIRPGVYMATINGVTDQLVVWHHDGGCTPTVSVNSDCLQLDDVTDLRPLVGLDPEQRPHAAALVQLFAIARMNVNGTDYQAPTEHDVDAMQAALRGTLEVLA